MSRNAVHKSNEDEVEVVHIANPQVLIASRGARIDRVLERENSTEHDTHFDTLAGRLCSVRCASHASGFWMDISDEPTVDSIPDVVDQATSLATTKCKTLTWNVVVSLA